MSEIDIKKQENKVEENMLLYTAINELLYLAKDILGISKDILDEVRFQKTNKEQSDERD